MGLTGAGERPIFARRQSGRRSPEMGAIFGAKIPFADLCGIEILGAEEGVTRLRVVLDERHGNNFGAPHGGLVATLMDIAMGSAARLAAGSPVMTVDMHINFIATGEKILTAQGRVVRAGGSILFAEAEARNENDEIVAKSSGVFKRRGTKKAIGEA
jgi:uncharacterized protein (TIGR00369 family)